MNLENQLRMNIELAFCEETGNVLDIFAARNYYFSVPKEKRRRLNFLCSHESCRLNGVKVTGANYDKLIHETDKFVRPYFRSNNKYKHQEDCLWLEYAIAVREMDEVEEKERTAEDGGEAAGHRRRRAKSSDDVEIFLPKGAVGETGGDGITGELINVSRTLNQRQRIQEIKNIIRRGPTKTSVLDNVVSCYRNMTNTKRQENYLRIGTGGCSRPYAEVFKHVSRINFAENDEHIFYGGAQVKKVGSADAKFHFGYRLTFYDKLPPDPVNPLGRRPLILYIPATALKESQRYFYLAEMLEDLSATDSAYAECFFYGILRPSSKFPNQIDVIVNHLSNLVLIRKSKPQK